MYLTNSSNSLFPILLESKEELHPYSSSKIHTFSLVLELSHYDNIPLLIQQYSIITIPFMYKQDLVNVVHFSLFLIHADSFNQIITQIQTIYNTIIKKEC